MEIKRQYRIEFWRNNRWEQAPEYLYAQVIDARAGAKASGLKYRIVEVVTTRTVVEYDSDPFTELQDKILKCTNMEELREQLDLIDWERGDA